MVHPLAMANRGYLCTSDLDALHPSFRQTGYDPAKQRFVGTWVGSMMSHLWVYEGELDATGKVLTLNSEGPSMAGDGSIQKYQDVIRVESDDHRILTSRAPGPDGKWNEFMTAHYRRSG